MVKSKTGNLRESPRRVGSKVGRVPRPFSETVFRDRFPRPFSETVSRDRFPLSWKVPLSGKFRHRRMYSCCFCAADTSEITPISAVYQFLTVITDAGRSLCDLTRHAEGISYFSVRERPERGSPLVLDLSCSGRGFSLASFFLFGPLLLWSVC